MAASKSKKVKQEKRPPDPHVGQVQNPIAYYSLHPAWHFSSCDTDMWRFTEADVGDVFWSEILPYLKSMETRTWGDIMVSAKKQNHSIAVDTLNPIAQKRFADLCIEAEAVISLRLSGTHRLYGYNVGQVFCILWYDNDHGDNDTCVCRSRKK